MKLKILDRIEEKFSPPILTTVKQFPAPLNFPHHILGLHATSGSLHISTLFAESHFWFCVSAFSFVEPIEKVFLSSLSLSLSAEEIFLSLSLDPMYFL